MAPGRNLGALTGSCHPHTPHEYLDVAQLLWIHDPSTITFRTGKVKCWIPKLMLAAGSTCVRMVGSFGVHSPNQSESMFRQVAEKFLVARDRVGKRLVHISLDDPKHLSSLYIPIPTLIIASVYHDYFRIS